MTTRGRSKSRRLSEEQVERCIHEHRGHILREVSETKKLRGFGPARPNSPRQNNLKQHNSRCRLGAKLLERVGPRVKSRCGCGYALGGPMTRRRLFQRPSVEAQNITKSTNLSMRSTEAKQTFLQPLRRVELIRGLGVPPNVGRTTRRRGWFVSCCPCISRLTSVELRRDSCVCSVDQRLGCHRSVLSSRQWSTNVCRHLASSPAAAPSRDS